MKILLLLPLLLGFSVPAIAHNEVNETFYYNITEGNEGGEEEPPRTERAPIEEPIGIREKE